MSPSVNETGTHAQDNGGDAPEPERDGQRPLVGEGESREGMVDIPGPLLVRITRVFCGRDKPYDDDNLSGGCKQLRDAIAFALGRKGDSEEDGFTWEYKQEKGEVPETVIEIFRAGGSK